MTTAVTDLVEIARREPDVAALSDRLGQKAAAGSELCWPDTFNPMVQSPGGVVFSKLELGADD